MGNPKRIAGAILAGGKSRRMGFDKAQARVAGEPLLARVVRMAGEADLEAIVVGRECPVDWEGGDVQFIADRWPDCGPIGGIASALGFHDGPVLALACDMPLLTANAIRWLLEETGPRRLPHGFVTVNSGRYEPLFAIYARSALPILEERILAGDYALQPLLRGEGFAPIDAPAWVCAELANANTPEELAALGAKKDPS